MKTYTPRLLVILTLAISSLSAVEINYTSPAFEIGKTSTGDPLTNGFTFELGSFSVFTPTAGNLAQWHANFTVLGTTNWDESFTQFSNTATLSSNAAPFGTSTQSFIWGYNFDTPSSSTEWILFTNPSWIFPASATVLPVSWDISDAGTIAIIGSLAGSLGADPYLQTAAVTAVPEPSAYAALIGLTAFGFAWTRRRRFWTNKGRPR
ncbi:MAG: PEP-CTERM sorting domain-containing protein [Opitutaceae bacterium]|jgi:hypothetical protein